MSNVDQLTTFIIEFYGKINSKMKSPDSELIIYQNKEGNIRIDVRLEEETVWLTQEQMALLFGKAKSTVNESIPPVWIMTLKMKRQ